MPENLVRKSTIGSIGRTWSSIMVSFVWQLIIDNLANAFRGSEINSFDPDDVISDCSGWTHTNSASIATKSPFDGKCLKSNL